MSEQRARERSDAALLLTPVKQDSVGRQGSLGEQGGYRALTVDEAVLLGQEGSLQTFPTAHGPAKQHSWGEGGV